MNSEKNELEDLIDTFVIYIDNLSLNNMMSRI